MIVIQATMILYFHCKIFHDFDQLWPKPNLFGVRGKLVETDKNQDFNIYKSPGWRRNRSRWWATTFCTFIPPPSTTSTSRFREAKSILLHSQVILVKKCTFLLIVLSVIRYGHRQVPKLWGFKCRKVNKIQTSLFLRIKGGSQTGVLADLETIWRDAIENLLNIPISELPKYRAVLIIPALYRRSLIKHYLVI